MSLGQKNLGKDRLRQGSTQTYHIHEGAGQIAHLQGDA